MPVATGLQRSGPNWSGSMDQARAGTSSMAPDAAPATARDMAVARLRTNQLLSTVMTANQVPRPAPVLAMIKAR